MSGPRAVQRVCCKVVTANRHCLIEAAPPEHSGHAGALRLQDIPRHASAMLRWPSVGESVIRAGPWLIGSARPDPCRFRAGEPHLIADLRHVAGAGSVERRRRARGARANSAGRRNPQ